MMIFSQDNVRVLQHEYLQIFYVQQWGECDNPHSYGRHFDFHTVLETRKIEEVRNKVGQLLESNK